MHNGKDKFINLTGRSMREVLFWEYLLHYEAMKLYYSKKVKKKKVNDKKQINSIFEEIEKHNLKKKIMLILKRPVSVLNMLLCHSKLGVYIPKQILYPVMRNLLYFEYLIQNLPCYIRGIAGKKDDFIFKYQTKKLRHRVNFEEVLSLRKINGLLREKCPKPKTLTERNQQILYLGR